MQLVALVGFKGSGKDTAARHLVNNFGFQPFSFAESLKDALASIFCWDRELLEGETAESRVWREQVDPWWTEKLGIPNFTPRLAMQLVGTDTFRQHFHPDIWILNIERKLSLLPADAKVVIRDGRFRNELNLGRKFGGRVVRVARGPDPDWYSTAEAANSDTFLHAPEAAAAMERIGVHISEWAWIGEPIDGTIHNNGSIRDLHLAVEKTCF